MQQQQRFVFDKDRHQYIVTRALVRHALSHYTGVEPAAWRFRQNAYGKPEVSAPAEINLAFNLSHTAGMVVCAVSSAPAVGVDVERLDRRLNDDAIADRFFSAAEAEMFRRAPPEQQQETFLRIWTLKESYIKARGMGLSIPLRDFAIGPLSGQPAAISFSGTIDDDPARWQFAQIRVFQDYQVALCVELPRGAPLVIQTREVVPGLPPGPATPLTLDSGHHGFAGA